MKSSAQLAMLVNVGAAILLSCGGAHISSPIDHRPSSPPACTPQSGPVDDCLTDADCAAGTACSCDANRGGAGASGSPTRCVPANCRVDADCGPGGFCSPSGFTGGPGGCGSFVNGFFCHTSHDECGNASDCGAIGMACIYSPEVAHWVCAQETICAG